MSDSVERDLWLDASPEEVWDVVTGPGWLAEDVDLDLTPGGEARFADRDGQKTGWIEEASPPARLAFWWAADGEPATRVEIAITRHEGRGTRLRVVESRPLDLLDLVGTPLPGRGGRTYGPALVAA